MVLNLDIFYSSNVFFFLFLFWLGAEEGEWDGVVDVKGVAKLSVLMMLDVCLSV